MHALNCHTCPRKNTAQKLSCTSVQIRFPVQFALVAAQLQMLREHPEHFCRSAFTLGSPSSRWPCPAQPHRQAMGNASPPVTGGHKSTSWAIPEEYDVLDSSGIGADSPSSAVVTIQSVHRASSFVHVLKEGVDLLRWREEWFRAVLQLKPWEQKGPETHPFLQNKHYSKADMCPHMQ